MSLQAERRQGEEGVTSSAIGFDPQLCNGCGACMEVCPTGAVYLVDGKAALDEALCRGCEACIAVCPTGAITVVTDHEAEAAARHLPVVRPGPEVIRVDAPAAQVATRAGAMSVVGAALAWAGREIVPRLADLLLDRLDRRIAESQVASAKQRRDMADRGGQGRGRRHRRRQRGGR